MRKDTVIYYPYYELEKDGLLKERPNHILNIKTFLLLADKVLLPPAHILDTDYKNILSLGQHLQPLIDNGNIFTTVGDKNKNLKEYYSQKKEENQNWTKYLNFKTEQIVEIFSNVGSFKNRDRIKQSAIYYDYLNELILNNDDVHKHFTQRKLDSILSSVNDLIQEKGYLLSKSDFDETILNLKKNRKLNQSQYGKLSDFSNSAYYYSGCIGNSAHIGHSSYFENIEISKLKSDIEFGPILFYDPKFFLYFLSKIGLSINENDIINLTADEIEEIRNHKGFNNFIDRYKKFCIICQQTIGNEIFEKEIINKFAIPNKSFKWIISYPTFLAGIGLITTGNPFSLTLFFVKLAESYFSNVTSFTKKINAKSIDKIRIELTDIVSPFHAFILKLENIINEK